MKKRILFLGASGFQIPVIEQAKKMGFFVGVIDISPNAPALKYADESFECSIKDKDAVLNIAKEFNADAVCVGVCDSAMNTAAFICDKLGLPGASIETAKCATDKFEMIKAFEKHGVAHPRFQLIKKENLSSDEINIDFPLVTKPIDAAGSKGIHIVRSEKDLAYALKDSSNCGYGGDVIVEELMEGPEVSVEMIIQNGVPFAAQITDKLTTGEPYFIEIGHTQPSHFEGKTLESIKELACNAAKAVGLQNSIAHAEVMITPNGPKMVEIAGRMGGGGSSEQLIQLSRGYNLAEASIDFSLGKSYVVDENAVNRCSAVRFILSKNGRVKSINGIEDARNIEGVYEINMMFDIGDVFEDAKDNAGRIGYVIASGETREEAINACNKALDLIDIEYE